MDRETREIRVTSTWEAVQTFDVPADWEYDGTLGGLLGGIQAVDPGEDITSEVASLIDWDVN